MNFINFLSKLRTLIRTSDVSFDDAVNLFRQYFKKDPEGMEVIGIRKEFTKAGDEKGKVIELAPRLPADAPYSANNPGGWMEGEGGLESLKGQVDDLAEQGKPYKKTTIGDFIADYFGISKKAETEAEMIARMNKQNKDAVKRLKDKKTRSAEEIMDDGDFDPSGMKQGGRVGFSNGGTKYLMIIDMLKKGADADTIKAITGASDMEIEEAITFFKYGQAGVPIPTFDESGKMIDDGLYKGRETRPENKATGGRVGFLLGGPTNIIGEDLNGLGPLGGLTPTGAGVLGSSPGLMAGNIQRPTSGYETREGREKRDKAIQDIFDELPQDMQDAIRNEQMKNIQGQTAGLGVASFLTKTLGPKVGAYVFKRGRDTFINKGIDMAQQAAQNRRQAAEAAAATVAALAEANRLQGRGGYQSSWGGVDSFMSGPSGGYSNTPSGTAAATANMGSFANGGMASLFTRRK